MSTWPSRAHKWHGLQVLQQARIIINRREIHEIYPWFYTKMLQVFHLPRIVWNNYILDDIISVWSSLRWDIDSGGLPVLNWSSKYLNCTSCNNSVGNINNSIDERSRVLISLEVSHVIDTSTWFDCETSESIARTVWCIGSAEMKMGFFRGICWTARTCIRMFIVLVDIRWKILFLSFS